MKKNIKLLIILAGVAVVLVGGLFWVLSLNTGEEATPNIDTGTPLEYSTDKDGMRQAKVVTDENGTLENNSFGDLLPEVIPADIKTMVIENEYGTITINAEHPTIKGTDPDSGEEVDITDATVYTLVGYEDYSLQAGMPEAIANNCTQLSFTKVASVEGDKPAEFGLDKPRATATVTYNDGTTAQIKVGDATQSGGVYITFGTAKTIYIVAEDSVSSFFFKITSLFDLNINKAATESSDTEFEYIKLSGEGFDKEIKVVGNKNEITNDFYVMESHNGMPVDSIEGSLITGGIRGLLAIEVIAVAPTEKQLGEYGLSPAFAVAEAKYPDVTVKLSASQADGEGKVYLYNNDSKIIYKIAAEKVAWAKTSFEKLLSVYVRQPRKDVLETIDVNIGGISKTVEVFSKTVDVIDEKGKPTTRTETSAKIDGKEMEAGSFDALYSALTVLERSDYQSNIPSDLGGTITYTYKNGKKDEIKFYTYSEGYIAVVNGNSVGTVLKAKIDEIVKLVK